MPALPSLRQLAYLVALSEKLSFTQAAEACFVTQSTLSAGIKELEATLGAQLVERDRQTVAMTPLGREVAERARSLLAAAEDLGQLAAGAAEPMTGLLRLGVIPT
ncbi:MAG TPA: LysR family transcriptional regulator, partial [Burkholderiales bacterium]|nr:LysR family transcriptional regulator [Burkholderiales bacterium]